MCLCGVKIGYILHLKGGHYTELHLKIQFVPHSKYIPTPLQKKNQYIQ